MFSKVGSNKVAPEESTTPTAFVEIEPSGEGVTKLCELDDVDDEPQQLVSASFGIDSDIRDDSEEHRIKDALGKQEQQPPRTPNFNPGARDRRPGIFTTDPEVRIRSPQPIPELNCDSGYPGCVCRTCVNVMVSVSVTRDAKSSKYTIVVARL